MDGVKNLIASRTFWGAIVAIGGAAAGFFGHEIDAATQAVITDQAAATGGAIATVIGGLLAIWGRIKASKKIG